jgi:hypothetical protein
MATVPRKTDLSPLEAIVVETTLGDLARKNTRDGALARIQLLAKERQKLYARSAGHPLLAPANAARIRAIGAEIDRLWDLLRRQRASTRVRIERALNVTSVDEDDHDDTEPGDHRGGANSTDAA